MIKSVLRVFTGVILVSVLAACAGQDVTYNRTYSLDFEGKFQDADAEQASLAKWDNAKVITLTHKDAEFTPMIVNLSKGKAYILKVVNEEDRTVSFRAPEFFNNASVTEISSTDHYTDTLPKQVKPLLVSFVVPPMGQREVRFVPLNEGRYEFENAFPGIMIGEFQFAPFSRSATMGTIGAFSVK